METPQRSAREQFDRQARHYDAQWNAWSEATLVWMLQHADCSPDDVLLDVATGTGFTALAFAPRVHSVIGVDVSMGMLEQARARAGEQGADNVTFQQSEAEALPFEANHFDIVTCRIAAHHFLSVTAFVSEAARVLRPNGRFLLVDTCIPDTHTEQDAEAGMWQNGIETLRDPSHVRNAAPEEWRNYVLDAGLELEQATSEGPGIEITLNAWMVKAGCSAEQQAKIREKFQTAPESAVRAFQIRELPDGDIAFVWQRILLKATKPV